ncbi:MAG: prolyl oligopeptidase family serine peptidase [Armatimonadia bacterium]|nr:prolyl oligopeptidase family serine peptidase [Armatimonadia bacterium]
MEPPKLLALSPAGERTEILRTETDRFADVPKPRVDRFKMPFSFSKRPEDESLLGKLILPPDFDPDRQYPVVLSCVYAGQGKSGFGRYQLLDSFMAAEMGYIAVGLDLRASMGYGHQFLTGYYKSLGIIDAEECVRCAEYLSGLPYVDGERIGIWGGSYGGFLVLMAMCNHPGVFHTGVSWKPVTDWRNYWDSYTAPRLTRPDDDREVFKATSPVFHAEGLEGNLLLVHGMQDDNVLFQDAAWMIQELVEAGKYFDLMIYPKDDHGLTKREESLPDLMERIAAYLEEHMGLGPIE